MSYFSLVYLSHETKQLNEGEIEKLVNEAQASNQQNAITGYLIYEEGVFIQYIEGKESNVLELAEKLKKDPRHEIESLVHLGLHTDRRFPKWFMRQVRLQKGHNIRLEDVLQFLMTKSNEKTFGPEAYRAKLIKIIEGIGN
jgi:hypothetical protein